MDADVEQLVREQRLLEAAQLASQRGDAAGASALFERACEWRSAGQEALRAGDPARALELALRAGDEALAEDAAAHVAVAPNADRVAARMAARGRHAWAARILEAVGRDVEAARAWEHAGQTTRAGALFERAAQPAEAARVLEAALRRDPGDFAAAVALGVLLVRFGRDAAGARVLQRVPPGAPERREALVSLAAALDRLGLADAARDASAELAALGGPPASLSGPPSAPAAGARLYGRYDIVRPVASSPRARVLEALDRAGGERVALKAYAAGEPGDAPARAALARLEADVRAVGALAHPSMVPVRALVAAGPTVVLAWMEGGTLEARLAKEPVAPDRAAEVARAVLGALAQAHRVGVLHRAVKPSNVLFDAAGAARLSDFGAAHAADASATITAGDLGVLEYLSPEQREGREVRVQSDLYAVGILLREMLVGRAHEGPPSRAHPRLDERHDALLARLTARAPEDRPADALQALELVAALPWPGPAPHGPFSRAQQPQGALAEGPRVQGSVDGAVVDTWTGRRIERVPLTEPALEHARLLARADHPALQAVLRVDRESGALWLAACDPPLERPLTPAEQARVDGALGALLAAGAPTSLLDRARVALQDGEVVVRLV